MPIFEYVCKSCNETFEVLEKPIFADEEKSCPNCGEKDLERIISASSFRLKGDGWYKKTSTTD